MNTLAWLLFESLPALAVLLFVVLFVLLVRWRRGGSARPLLIALAAAAILLITQSLVVTRGEHASRIMKRIELDIIASRVDALAASLAPEFYFDQTPWEPDEFVERVRRELRHLDVRSLTRRRLELTEGGADNFATESHADTFSVEISYLVDFTLGQYGGMTISRWRIGFVRQDDAWRIRQITPIDREDIPRWPYKHGQTKTSP